MEIEQTSRNGAVEWNLYDNRGNSRVSGMLEKDDRPMETGRENADPNSRYNSLFKFNSGISTGNGGLRIGEDIYRGIRYLDVSYFTCRPGKRKGEVEPASGNFSYEVIIDFRVDLSKDPVLHVREPMHALPPWDPQERKGPGGIRTLTIFGLIGNVALAEYEIYRYEGRGGEEKSSHTIHLSEFADEYNRDRFRLLQRVSCTATNWKYEGEYGDWLTCGTGSLFQVLERTNESLSQLGSSEPISDRNR